MILYEGQSSTNISLVLAGEDIYLCLHHMNVIVEVSQSALLQVAGGIYDFVVR